MKKLAPIAALLSCLSFGSAFAQTPDKSLPGMNAYIVRATKYLEQTYPNLGYDLSSTLTHDLAYGNETIRATNPPKSMCVAAMIEVIVESFRLWKQEHGGNDTAHAFLPAASWRSLRPRDIKSHIWVDPRLNAYGTGDALDKFGMGERLKFNDLRPGDFANINRPAIPGVRKKASGHAVVFLSFVDGAGKDISDPAAAKGIRYFSHQGSTNGFAQKLGFFMQEGRYVCPTTASGSPSKDCGIMFSRDQRYLNLGRLWEPERWDATKRDQYIADLSARLRRESNSRGPGFLGLSGNLTSEQFDIELERLPDVMVLNPLFVNDVSE